jgi:hypothetical protein
MCALESAIASTSRPRSFEILGISLPVIARHFHQELVGAGDADRDD